MCVEEICVGVVCVQSICCVRETCIMTHRAHHSDPRCRAFCRLLTLVNSRGSERTVGAVSESLSSNTWLCFAVDREAISASLLFVFFLYHRRCFDSTPSQGRSLRQDHHTSLSGNGIGPAYHVHTRTYTCASCGLKQGLELQVSIDKLPWKKM